VLGAPAHTMISWSSHRGRHGLVCSGPVQVRARWAPELPKPRITLKLAPAGAGTGGGHRPKHALSSHYQPYAPPRGNPARLGQGLQPGGRARGHYSWYTTQPSLRGSRQPSEHREAPSRRAVAQHIQRSTLYPRAPTAQACSVSREARGPCRLLFKRCELRGLWWMVGLRWSSPQRGG
jgi:hypothetical protein